MNKPNWTFTVDLDAAAHIYFGTSVNELDKSELKEIKEEFEKQVRSGMKRDLARLQQSNHKVFTGKEYVSVKNVTPETLMEVLRMLLSWTGDLGDHFIDDLKVMIPVNEISSYLKQNDPELLTQFQTFVEDNYWD